VQKSTEINFAIFLVISKSSHTTFMLCIALALFSVSMLDTVLAFLLIFCHDLATDIIESVDSICRDSADTQYMLIIESVDSMISIIY